MNIRLRIYESHIVYKTVVSGVSPSSERIDKLWVLCVSMLISREHGNIVMRKD